MVLKSLAQVLHTHLSKVHDYSNYYNILESKYPPVRGYVGDAFKLNLYGMFPICRVSVAIVVSLA